MDGCGGKSNSFKLLWKSLLPTNEEDPFKNEGARVVTTLFINFSDAQGQANSEVGDGILPKFKLIRAFMVGLVICKNEEDPSKNEGARVVTTFLPL